MYSLVTLHKCCEKVVFNAADETLTKFHYALSGCVTLVINISFNLDTVVAMLRKGYLRPRIPAVGVRLEVGRNSPKQGT